MGDFEAPSFSLGFDFDDLPEPQITPPNRKTVVDYSDENELRPRLKRLRRRCCAVDGGLSGFVKGKNTVIVVDDDDIEVFSSPEDNNSKDETLPTQHYSVSNSSKFSLMGLGVRTKGSGKRKQNLSNISNTPESVITSCSKRPFPKLAVSPLRKFQLIDSDSDSDILSISKVNKTCNTSEPYLDRRQSVDLEQPRNLNESLDTSVRKDLWEERGKVRSNIGKGNNKTHVMDGVIDLGDPCPPAHRYFFHSDLRIQELVGTRLCNFFPLNTANIDSRQPSTSNIDYMGQFMDSVKDLSDLCLPAHQYFFHSGLRIHELVRTRLCNFFPLNTAKRDSRQPSTSNIDYMGQFSSGDKTEQAARTNKAETSSSRKYSRKSKIQKTSQGFMNSKVNTVEGITKDAGKEGFKQRGLGSQMAIGRGFMSLKTGKR